MRVVVSYDVATSSPGGPKRLRSMARVCLDFGQRVQFSVFECSVGPVQWVELRHRVLEIADLELDSVRFYFLGDAPDARVEHHGIKKARDLDGPLIV